MKRTSRIFLVKSYDVIIRRELGGEGLYYAFGYQSEWTSYRIFVFNLETLDYKILMKDGAKDKLEYYEDEPMDVEQENKLIKRINDEKSLTIT